VKKSIFILMIIPLLILISCKSKNNSSEKMKIISVLQSQQNAWNRGDIEEYMNGYLRSDSLRFASGGNIRYGWNETLSAYKKGYPSKSKMGNLIFGDIKTDILSDKYALVFGKWKLERRTDHPSGLFTLLFIKTKDGWRIAADHTSSAKDN